jgi:hypothetical protein
MTLVESSADHRIRSYTHALLARVDSRAGGGIVAGCPVCLGRVGTEAGRRIADAGHVALVKSSADHRIRATADALLTSVDERAEVAVVTGRVVGRLRVRAHPRRRVAHTCHIALAESSADHRISSYTDTRKA